MFIPLQKVDAAQRLVYGSIGETLDRGGERMDYASSKPNFQAWSERLSKASDGKSLGNVRVMHQLKVAGVLKALVCNDATKTFDVCAHIVDDEEWAKVEAGAYTGFSPGGSAKRWKQDGVTLYTARPVELSLVDLPCIPDSTFTMIKADGALEQRSFALPPEMALTVALAGAGGTGEYRGIVLAQSADTLAKAFGAEGEHGPLTILAKRDFSAAQRRQDAADGKALPDGSFPIESKADLENAVEAFGHAGDKEAAKKHIIERAKELGATDQLPADWPSSTKAEKVATIDGLKKGMGDVAQFAGLLQSLAWLAGCVTTEAMIEADGSPLPKRICLWIADGAAIFEALGTEETSELIAKLKQGLPPDVADLVAAETVTDLAKAASKEAVQGIHDHAVSLGASCGSMKAVAIGDLVKMAGDRATALDSLAKVETENTLLKAEVATLKAMPPAHATSLRAVPKTQDTGAEEAGGNRGEAHLAKVNAMPEDTPEQRLAKAMELTKVAHLKPRGMAL